MKHRVEADRPYLALSRAIARLPGLDVLLGAPVRHVWTIGDPRRARAVLAWGCKPSARKAALYAERRGLPLLRVEDGLLRSVGLGNEAPPLSIVVDDLGIYYDAGGPSRLEALVRRAHSEAECARARALVDAWCDGRVSKYNSARELRTPLADDYVLVVDQTYGDASIRCGQADETSFARMLEAALDEHPRSAVILKVHPDVVAGRKRGHYAGVSPGQASRVRILGSTVHPAGLIEGARAVYTVTSQMGFEALLWGRPVRTFGMPFYAGWGLTRDELPAPGRRGQVAITDLAHAALIEYPRYVDPESGVACEAERVLAWMALQRRMRERFPPTVEAIGFSLWKRPIVRAFFQGTTVRFRSHSSAASGELPRVVWGSREADASAGVIRIEDGFLRSVGLGADLVRPLSWVIDRRGIYYDAGKPSDLEVLLQTRTFDDAVLQRARRLRERIVAEGLTKYNISGRAWTRPEGARRVLLVAGQVETDASIAAGATNLRRNIELLRAVREANPDAWVVYKPHPDVVAGLRKAGVGEDDAGQWCDELVVDAPIGALLSQVDEVHVLTSLAGFEALLRGKVVHCYGLPFYAGWGLTRDHAPCARRARRLNLDELVAGVLIEYPTYVSAKTGSFTGPERVLDELIEWRGISGSRLAWWRRPLRLILGWRRN